jgi:hypothetical protein
MNTRLVVHCPKCAGALRALHLASDNDEGVVPQLVGFHENPARDKVSPRSILILLGSKLCPEIVLSIRKDTFSFGRYLPWEELVESAEKVTFTRAKLGLNLHAQHFHGRSVLAPKVLVRIGPVLQDARLVLPPVIVQVRGKD